MSDSEDCDSSLDCGTSYETNYEIDYSHSAKGKNFYFHKFEKYLPCPRCIKQDCICYSSDEDSSYLERYPVEKTGTWMDDFSADSSEDLGYGY